jgi:hypothetical protein
MKFRAVNTTAGRRTKMKMAKKGMKMMYLITNMRAGGRTKMKRNMKKMKMKVKVFALL